MTARGALWLWIASAVLLPIAGLLGALFKVQHWPYEWVWQVAAWLFNMAMSMILGTKVLRYPGFKDFLDR